MGMCSTDILADLQNIRENPKRILIYSDFDSASQQGSNEVYFSLVMLTTGEAATIVRTVRDNNAYEAYRPFRQRFEPENYCKHVTSLTQNLKFDFGSNFSEFLDKPIEWEGFIDKYEQGSLETISKNLFVCHCGRESARGHPDALACPMWREPRLVETASDRA